MVIFSSQGILNRLEKSRNLTQNNFKKLDFLHKITGKVYVIFIFFSDLNFLQFLFLSVNFNLTNGSKILENEKINTGKVREIYQSDDVGAMVLKCSTPL